jgi:hypothetical protein
LQGKTGERWRTLCEQAALEQDPSKLLKLVEEINQLLDSKEKRLLGEQEEADMQSAA